MELSLIDYIGHTYLTLLMLFGLGAAMLANRDNTHLRSKYYVLFIITLFLISSSDYLELWAHEEIARIPVRIVTSVIGYVLQPVLILLGLVLIRPPKQKREYLIAVPAALNAVIYLAAPFTGGLVFTISETNQFYRGPLGYTVYVVNVFYLVMLLIWSVRIFREEGRQKSMVVLFIVVAGLSVALLEVTNTAPGYVEEVSALCGLLYYVYLNSIYESRMQKELAREKLASKEQRIRLMQEQIQPHFLFNSLHVIKYLIKNDQRRAVESIDHFSDYLRGNLDALRSEGLIPFEEELTHIEAYVALEQSDTSRQVQVVYDLGEMDFRLPALTVEPIVENAIRHGLGRSNGQIVLATRREAGEIVITVADNGSGFPGATPQAKKRQGIGIENARSRLALQCNGSLDIDSGEAGTTVTIRIPLNHPGKGGQSA